MAISRARSSKYTNQAFGDGGSCTVMLWLRKAGSAGPGGEWVPRPPANVAYLSMYLRGRVRTQRITSGLANFVAWTFARLCKKNK
jgi:hypothetical protein